MYRKFRTLRQAQRPGVFTLTKPKAAEPAEATFVRFTFGRFDKLSVRELLC